MKHTSPYLSAQALGITEAEREALIWVYRGLKSGTIPAEQYDQTVTDKRLKCGTAACIGGWMAYRLYRTPAVYVHSKDDERSSSLGKLFWGRTHYTPLQSGIQACLNTLTLGDPCWDELP